MEMYDMRNVTGIACFLRSRELYATKAKRDLQKFQAFDGVKEALNKFNEYHMRNLYCSNRSKYVIPGDTETEVPPYAIEFCTAPGNEETFAVADENGMVSLFCDGDESQNDTEKYLKPVFKLRAHNNAIFDIAWIPLEHIIATASGDQSAALWDVKKGEVITVFKGHTCSLKSISVSKHNTNMLATGSRDGNALIWDRRCSPQPVMRIQDAHVINDCLTPMRKRRRSTVDSGQLGIDSRQTVSSVIFQDNQTVITSGAMDGMLKIWDLRKIHIFKKTSGKNSPKNLPKEMIPYPGKSQRRRGYTCLTIDQSCTNLYASCTDDSIYHYNLATAVSDYNARHPICKYQGHYNTSFYVRTALSPDDQFLLSGSDDNKSYIWRVDGKRSHPALRLTSEGMSEVTAVAWCPSNFTKLITCSDECVVRQWKLLYKDRDDLKLTDIDGHCEVLDESHIKKAHSHNSFTPALVARRSSVDEIKSPQCERLFASTTLGPTRTPQKIDNLTFSSPHHSPLCDNHKKTSGVKKTPASIEKWLIRTPTQGKGVFEQSNDKIVRNRAVKCLEHHMGKISENSDFDKENDGFESRWKISTKELPAIKENDKNWLLQLSKRKRSTDSDCLIKAVKKSPETKKHKLSPTSSNKTPNKSVKTLDMYFNNTP